MWTYRKKEVTNINSLPKEATSFIYTILLSSGKEYIGKKALFHKKTLKPLKGKKRKRVTYKESDWLRYTGSNKTLNTLLKNNTETIVQKKILKVCYSKQQASYWEAYYLFTNKVLHSDKYYNENILGKFYSKAV